MSAERMTSRAEANMMRDNIMTSVRYLEDAGFDRGQIAAAMLGISGGLMIAHSGRRAINDGIAAIIDAADSQRPN